MHGIRKILFFCTMIVVLPITLLIIPLYLRNSVYSDVAYAVTESDIMEVNDGISSIFCSGHIIRMNGTFNAFQMAQRPEVTSSRKHIRLKKSINLPDDTLEYWGFYLLKGATVTLSVCSRFEGASMLVVKGERNFHTCGLLRRNNEKGQVFLPTANEQVKIINEPNVQVAYSTEVYESVKMSDIGNTQSHANVNSKNHLETDFKVSTTDNITWAHNASAITPEVENHLNILYNKAASYVHKHTDNHRPAIVNNIRKTRNMIYDNMMNRQRKTKKSTWKKEGNDMNSIQGRSRKMRIQKLGQILHSYAVSNEKDMYKQSTEIKYFSPKTNKVKRSREFIKPPSLLDQGIRHGGNADKSASVSNDVSSVSSFEYGLFSCFGASILLAHEFEPSDQCTDIDYLLSGRQTQTSHHVEDNGYYYYIFYSDNDIISNDIYALFDIHKPTFQYENITKSCINQTECSFSLSMLSSDRVIVEIPTRNGIELDERDDIHILISACEPRVGIFIIFPVAIMLIILGCAFVE